MQFKSSVISIVFGVGPDGVGYVVRRHLHLPGGCLGKPARRTEVQAVVGHVLA